RAPPPRSSVKATRRRRARRRSQREGSIERKGGGVAGIALRTSATMNFQIQIPKVKSARGRKKQPPGPGRPRGKSPRSSDRRRAASPIPGAAADCMDDIYADDSPGRGRGSESPSYRGSSPRRAATRRRDVADDESDSSGSHFSRDPVESETGTRRRGGRGRRGDDRAREEVAQHSQRRIQEKRQRTKDALAEMQRMKAECIDVDGESDGDGGERATETRSCFDGIAIDQYNNPEKGRQMERLVEQLGDDGDDEDHRHEILADPTLHGRGGDPTRKGRYGGRNGSRRGMQHGKSALARTPRNGAGTSSNHCSLRRGGDRYIDPLDEAAHLQDNDRSSPSTSSHFRKHPDDRADDGGDRKYRSRCARETVVERLEESPQAKGRRGKDGAAVRDTGENTSGRKGKNTEATKGMAKTMSSLVNMLKKPDMKANRTKRAAAAARRERIDEDDDCDDARTSEPSSGEKRKSERGGDRREGGPLAKRRQDGPLGSRGDAIDVDGDSEDDDVRGGSARSAEGPGRAGGGDDEEEDAILAAVDGCNAYVDEAEYSTPRVKRNEDPESRGGRGRKTSHYFGAKHASGAKKEKRHIRDMNSYLRSSKKVDHVVDDSSGVQMKDTAQSTADRALGRPIPRKKLPQVNDERNDGWLSRRDKDNDSGKRDRGKPSRPNATRDKLTGRGMRADAKGKDEFEFRDGSTPPSSTSGRRGKSGKKKRQSKLSSHSNGFPRTTRSRSKSRERATNDIITIDDSSDEDEMSVEDDVQECVAHDRPRRGRPPGDRASIDAVRIAIGTEVFKSRCQLSFQFGTAHPYILFAYFDGKGKKNEHTVFISDDELKEVKYFIARDDVTNDIDDAMTVIAFRITPTDKNNFVKYPRSYLQDEKEEDEDTERRYITVEVRDTDEFQAMLVQMRQHRGLELWCGDDSEIHPDDLAKYTQALLSHNREERRLSVAARTRSGRNRKQKSSNDNKLLLVYPFNVDEKVLTEAATGLKELGGDLLGVDLAHGDAQLLDAEMPDQSVGGSGDDDNNEKYVRTHYVTIRQDDKDRLSPGEFLNDTLVDFWMRWISRGERQQRHSNVHFFTSHFMTTLKDEGVEAVTSWTAKKNINVFEKKLIFVPVNADLHWSLCVVINPGFIANSFEANAASEDEEHACILFLDSLKMHSKNIYARHIRKWLNSEWKRLKKGKVDGHDEPFDHETIRLRSPRIPYQENGCDCGVFVCRYAYNLYVLRHQKITWEDITEKPPFEYLITNNTAFEFDMLDIARIREEIGTLIDNLSKHYLRIKVEENKNKKAKRKAKRSGKDEKESVDEKQSVDATNESAPIDALSEAIEDGGTTSEGVSIEADIAKDGDAVMLSSEEKENIAHSSVEAVSEKQTPPSPGVQSGPDDIISPVL
ncbi:hypothetical protein ACHAWF_014773, partial [Thalassiosira exigua]